MLQPKTTRRTNKQTNKNILWAKAISGSQEVTTGHCWLEMVMFEMRTLSLARLQYEEREILGKIVSD